MNQVKFHAQLYLETESNPDYTLSRYGVIVLLLELECVLYLQRLGGSLAAWIPVVCPGVLHSIPSYNSAVGKRKKELLIGNSEERFLTIATYHIN